MIPILRLYPLLGLVWLLSPALLRAQLCSAATSQSISSAFNDFAGEQPLTIGESFNYCVNTNELFGNTAVITFLGNQNPFPISVTILESGTANFQTLTAGGQSANLNGGSLYSITIMAVATGTQTVRLSVPSVAIVPDFDATVTVEADPLPVAWASPLRFRAAAKHLTFNWSVTDQRDVAGYWLERAGADSGGDFQPIGFLPARPGRGELHYTLTTELPATASHYRIRQTDHDGAFSLSNVVTVPHHAGTVRVAPNPARGQLRTTAGPAARQKLLDATGRPVLAFRGPAAGVAHLPPGLYTLISYGEDAAAAPTVQRVLLQR